MAKKDTSKVRTSERKTKTITEQFNEVAVQSEKAIAANEKRLYSRFVSQIDREYKKMENCYLNTAFALHALYAKKLYKVGGYQNIYELAADKFNIARGTCNNFINICQKFGLPNENGTIVDLQETFKTYNMSQLMVMLNMNQELLNMCSPSMSVRALKDMKSNYIEEHTRELEQLSTDNSMNEPIENSDPVGNEGKEVFEEDSYTTTDNRQFICSVSNYEELIKLKDIINETLADVKKSKHLKDVRLELNVVF